jgi:acyl-CoA synthetase (AMP-forming)/AMP-acid ligase II
MVQVIGGADDRLGEVPVAFVERSPGGTVSARELIAMCEGQIAKWKIPRDVIFVTEWPLSTTKVQKFRLKELLPARFRNTPA